VTLLDDIRTAVRVSPIPVDDESGNPPDSASWVPTYTSDFDGELSDLMYAAFADMTRAGVRPELLDADTPDPLVKLAVKTYAKAHFGYDNDERQEFIASYERILIDLKNSSWSNVEYWRVSVTDCVIEPIPAQPYTGSTVRPVPTVTFDGVELEYGRDFRVSYKDNVDVGTAKVFVEGTGSYKGATNVTFEIVGE